jgi:O-methyltransferase
MSFATRLVHTARLLGPRRFVRLAFDRLRHPNPIRPWETDPEFLRLVGEIADHTLVDRVRLYMLYQLVKQTLPLAGAVAEIGVYRGGSAKLLARVCDGKKKIHLFDTFEGMPETHPTHDFHERGDFADTSLEAVRAYLSDCPEIDLHPGFFPASAGGMPEQLFSLVHVDVDIYASVLSCCEYFFPRMVAGGVLVFDDYGMVTCEGAKIALDEFCAAHGQTPIYLPSGQCLPSRAG